MKKQLNELIEKNYLDSGGRCCEDEGQTIKELVHKTNATLCAEIGVYRGSSLMYFIEALQETSGIVIGIDPYAYENLHNTYPTKKTHDRLHTIFPAQESVDSLYENLSKIIKDNNLEKLVRLIRDTSANASSSFENNTIDVLHIDGNHDEEYVTLDILNYLPLVKPNGYIIMDDINWVGVKNSISKHLISKASLIKRTETYEVYQKNHE